MAGGSSPSGPQDLYLTYAADGNAALTVNSIISDNGSSAVRLVVSGAGPTFGRQARRNARDLARHQHFSRAARSSTVGTLTRRRHWHAAGFRNGLTINNGTVTQVSGGTITSQAVTLNGGSILTLVGANSLTNTA